MNVQLTVIICLLLQCFAHAKKLDEDDMNKGILYLNIKNETPKLWKVKRVAVNGWDFSGKSDAEVYVHPTVCDNKEVGETFFSKLTESIEKKLEDKLNEIKMCQFDLSAPEQHCEVNYKDSKIEYVKCMNLETGDFIRTGKPVHKNYVLSSSFGTANSGLLIMNLKMSTEKLWKVNSEIKDYEDEKGFRHLEFEALPTNCATPSLPKTFSVKLEDSFDKLRLCEIDSSALTFQCEVIIKSDKFKSVICKNEQSEKPIKWTGTF